MSQIYECYPDIYRLRYFESAYEMKLGKKKKDKGVMEGDGRMPTHPRARFLLSEEKE